MNRDELEYEIELSDLLNALAKAKKLGSRDKLREAKEAVFALRSKHRVAASPGLAGPGEASPASLKVKAKGN